jgi:Fic family protein
VATVQRLFELLNRDRRRLLAHRTATIPAVRLWEALPSRPIVTLPAATNLMHTSKPTAAKAIATLCDMKILQEISGRRRDRVYAYQAYLAALTSDDA